MSATCIVAKKFLDETEAIESSEAKSSLKRSHQRFSASCNSSNDGQAPVFRSTRNRLQYAVIWTRRSIFPWRGVASGQRASPPGCELFRCHHNSSPNHRRTCRRELAQWAHRPLHIAGHDVSPPAWQGRVNTRGQTPPASTCKFSREPRHANLAKGSDRHPNITEEG
ncbi:hypothetical protein T10_12161 [Trichinella papuae]|uniref:Uncharacterized protein n=1 Tax=Trichinella papuae TaxID=268474 RepID=A0A0V1N085_9BILA|nr:hypothetical protein T10_12161 [Trichinella papuae]